MSSMLPFADIIKNRLGAGYAKHGLKLLKNAACVLVVEAERELLSEPPVSSLHNLSTDFLLQLLAEAKKPEATTATKIAIAFEIDQRFWVVLRALPQLSHHLEYRYRLKLLGSPKLAIDGSTHGPNFRISFWRSLVENPNFPITKFTYTYAEIAGILDVDKDKADAYLTRIFLHSTKETTMHKVDSNFLVSVLGTLPQEYHNTSPWKFCHFADRLALFLEVQCALLWDILKSSSALQQDILFYAFVKNAHLQYPTGTISTNKSHFVQTFWVTIAHSVRFIRMTKWDFLALHRAYLHAVAIRHHNEHDIVEPSDEYDSSPTPDAILEILDNQYKDDFDHLQELCINHCGCEIDSLEWKPIYDRYFATGVKSMCDCLQKSRDDDNRVMEMDDYNEEEPWGGTIMGEEWGDATWPTGENMLPYWDAPLSRLPKASDDKYDEDVEGDDDGVDDGDLE